MLSNLKRLSRLIVIVVLWCIIALEYSYCIIKYMEQEDDMTWKIMMKNNNGLVKKRGVSRQARFNNYPINALKKIYKLTKKGTQIKSIQTLYEKEMIIKVITC